MLTHTLSEAQPGLLTGAHSQPPPSSHAPWTSNGVPRGVNTQHHLYYVLIAKYQEQLSSRGKGKDSSITLSKSIIIYRKFFLKKGSIVGH